MVNYRKNVKLRQTERRRYPRGFFPVQAECQTVYKERKDCKRSNQDFFAKRRDWKPRRGYPYCGSAKERNSERLAKAEAFRGENHRRKPHCKPARKSRRERDSHVRAKFQFVVVRQKIGRLNIHRISTNEPDVARRRRACCGFKNGAV